jgi:ParB family chromosome partitioning protein
VEEIGRHYGMSDREVEQALALGHLSPKIRDAWRAGDIKAQAAKAFTLAADHAAQDKLLDDLRDDAQTGRGPDLSDVDAGDVKEMLKIGEDNSGALVEFVGIEAYVKRGGKVTRDLFGTDHQVSDPKLAKTMAAEKLKAECENLVKAGWSFAVTTESVRSTQYNYGRLKVDDAEPTEEEAKKLAELNAMFNGGHHRHGYYDADSFFELTGPQQKAYLDYHTLKDEIERRRFPEKLMAKAGCFVGLDEDGFLDVEYGRVKPAKREEAERETKTVKREQTRAASTAAVAAGKPAPESTDAFERAEAAARGAAGRGDQGRDRGRAAAGQLAAVRGVGAHHLRADHSGPAVPHAGRGANQTAEHPPGAQCRGVQCRSGKTLRCRGLLQLGAEGFRGQGDHGSHQPG